MERKMTMKNVNKMRTQRKLLVKWVKRREYFIKPIVHVNN